MSNFLKTLLGLSLGGLVALPTIANYQRLGFSTETNPKVIKALTRDCPPAYRRADGICRRSHRSYYRRSYFGGGPRGGK